MNIWIFNHYGVGPNSSGITRHFDLAKELVSKGHNVTIFAASFNHQKREEQQKYDKGNEYVIYDYNGVKFYWIKTPKYYKNDYRRILNMLLYTYRTNKLVKKVEGTPDIIIGSLMHPLAAILGYKISKKLKTKFYFEERDLWPQSLIDLGKISSKSVIVKVLSKLELFLYKKADKIIVLFDKAPKYVKKRGIKSEKIIYLPNGVDFNLYKVEKKLPDLYLNTLYKLKDKFLLVYTGAHGLANNLGSMLEIAEKVYDQDENIHFLLVGDGPEKDKIIRQADEKNLKNLTFLPSIQKDCIPSLLKYANAGIITMHNAEVYKWGISLNKMFDYMAACLPIVMLSNLQDTIISKQNLGIVSSNVDNIAERIVKLSNNKALLEKYSVNSFMYGKQNHSWEKLAEKLETNFYDN
ncbi:glycosyltransferase family 4 protein [Halobacillus sp. Marseille-P3879]|uniref:glycosyltransferase family 4 protein n=1 Tax=Halobacillus sp. Marseille-P3879 TaxID=2045014 RepID=UPI000C7E5E07|nr:glycosyltransferase family 4 protein [Halobacillus sp. Marseille-P3879]